MNPRSIQLYVAESRKWLRFREPSEQHFDTVAKAFKLTCIVAQATVDDDGVVGFRLRELRNWSSNSPWRLKRASRDWYKSEERHFHHHQSLNHQYPAVMLISQVPIFLTFLLTKTSIFEPLTGCLHSGYTLTWQVTREFSVAVATVFKASIQPWINIRSQIQKIYIVCGYLMDSWFWPKFALLKPQFPQ